MFSWDTQKAITNFETDDLKHTEQEKRFKRLGISVSKRILLVIYTIRRSKDEKETIRIISARQASSKERKVYARQRD